MSSHTLVAPETRVLDASQIVGPDSLADILGFLGVDQEVVGAASARAYGESGLERAIDDAA